jgi:Na+/pantothenate symporter
MMAVVAAMVAAVVAMVVVAAARARTQMLHAIAPQNLVNP